ncbi:MAG: hypothetical protein A3D96_06930 [Chlamydiae bacterium RIFCSPHIGHO2_12_FULL_44_59]|nr:MAG: hypothetical protein A2796_05855 [Chlamydiae bacterium RIFCSPHIGHO2_01_FULL_44_39]OGN57217.1 MAG: hypothetical protein A3C42_02135 [Chlamydiae bacterium RIFCSPHIGHO2_02_FULL_45_9]OGN60375.1 MAG: hypothetical protein A3D96_06930 [Chlamydiae bacterium RIFCSPHIGHO2_12_FULL_44_59]OGN66360.1 MAG: hypothetical protein A2978_06990 [Chlamydiae bacterium RIFCSPLOWO2_01_FULL_44_52]OGN69393.1 MAG: hypothetical protein A3I67_06510 [Chlamydiae bacterium RIFCSPLOWO2_02_FULL_45_22]OGN70546.1 MAG: hyp
MNSLTRIVGSEKEGPICAICTDEIFPAQTVSRLNCDHEYHKVCLQPWLAQHDTCPLDRRKITSINGEPTESEEKNQTNAPRVAFQNQVDVPMYAPRLEFQDPLLEARDLYQQSIRRVIRNPSRHSDDPVERTAAKVQTVFFSIFGAPQQPTARRPSSDDDSIYD